MLKGESETGREVRSAFKKAGPYINIGYILIGSVIFFAWLGFKADKHWEMEPLFLLIGLFFGFGLGLYNMLKVLKQTKDQ